MSPSRLSALLGASLMLLVSCNTNPGSPAPELPPSTSIDSFGANPNPAPANSSIQFSWSVVGVSLTCTLDVDSDQTIDYTITNCTSQSRVSHVYDRQGTFEARLMVKGSDGLQKERRTPVTLGAPNHPPTIPVLRAALPAAAAASPLGVTFFWQVDDRDADITRCQFDADSNGTIDFDALCSGLTAVGSPQETSTVTYTHTHTYPRPGRYLATLVATDPYAAAEARITVRVPYNTAPQVDYLHALGQADLTGVVRFQVSDPDGDPLSCILTIEGMGKYSYANCREGLRSLKFLVPGRYTITLVVSDGTLTTTRSTVLTCGTSCNYLEIGTPLTLGHVNSSPTAMALWDDQLLISGGYFGDLKMYRKTGQGWRTIANEWQLGPVRNADHTVNSTAIHPSGTLLATASKTGEVRLWRISTDQLTPLATLYTHTGPATDVAFSPDGSWLASASLDSSIQLWTISGITATFSHSHTSDSPINDLAFNASGNLLATAHGSLGGSNYKAMVWANWTTGSPSTTTMAHDYYPVEGVDFNPNYQPPVTCSTFGATICGAGSHSLQGVGDTTALLATAGGYNNAVYFWAADGNPVGSPLGLGATVHGVRYSPNGSQLLVKADKYYLYKTSSMEEVGYTPQLNSSPMTGKAMGFFSDGSQLAAGNSYSLTLWDITGTGVSPYTDSGVVINPVPLAPTSNVEDIAFRPQGDLVATSDINENLQLYDVASGTPIGMMISTDDEGDITSLSFHPDGNLLAGGSSGVSGDLYFWTVTPQTGLQLGQRWQDVYDGRIYATVYSPSGRQIAFGGNNSNAVKVWNTGNATQVHQFAGHTDTVNSLAWSPDGKWLASASNDDTVRIWNLTSGQLARTLVHYDDVTGVAWSPDGFRIATSSRDSITRLWNAYSGDQMAEAVHPAVVTHVAFSPDGAILAAADSNETVRLWDAQTLQARGIGPTTRPNAEITALRFSAIGDRLAVGTDDRQLVLWDFVCTAN